MPNFVLHHEEYESGYLEGVQENLALTSQAGFSGINVRSQMIRGDFEKETVFSGDVNFNSRDPAGTAPRPTERFDLEEHIGVKVHYNTPKQKIPQSDLQRSNFSNEAYSNKLGMNVAQNEFKFILNMSLKALKAAIPVEAANSLTSANFTKTDFVSALRPMKDNAEEAAGYVMARASMFDVIEEGITANRFGEVGPTVYGGSPGTLGIPVMASALDALDDGTNQWMFALYANAMQITLNSNAPSIVIRDNDDEENHFQTWSLDATYNLKLRGLSYVGTGGNVTEALLTNAANWQAVASSPENQCGTVTRFGP